MVAFALFAPPFDPINSLIPAIVSMLLLMCVFLTRKPRTSYIGGQIIVGFVLSALVLWTKRKLHACIRL